MWAGAPRPPVWLSWQTRWRNVQARRSGPPALHPRTAPGPPAGHVGFPGSSGTCPGLMTSRPHGLVHLIGALFKAFEVHQVDLEPLPDPLTVPSSAHPYSPSLTGFLSPPPLTRHLEKNPSKLFPPASRSWTLIGHL